jgi:hypothetical protein
MIETVYIDSEGSICGLNGYILDNLDLGEKSVYRVSNIEFNHALQLWEAVDNCGKVIGRNSSRTSLVELEKEYLNKRIEENYAKNKDGFFKETE